MMDEIPPEVELAHLHIAWVLHRECHSHRQLGQQIAVIQIALNDAYRAGRAALAAAAATDAGEGPDHG